MHYVYKREAKANIAEALMGKGWTVYGYHEDQSDSMTDYYSPACWLDGIAEKNGYVLIVDNDTNSKSGYEVTQKNYNGSTPFQTQEKISKLERMTVERGASEQEEETAKRAIEKLLARQENNATIETIKIYPTFAYCNPRGSKWHIEKDGAILAKGTGIFKFCSMPYDYSTFRMKYEPRKYYNHQTGESELGKLSEEQQKLVTQFEALINKFESIANQATILHDGTEEGKQRAAEQAQADKLEKITVTEKKIVLKMVEVQRDHFKVDDFITLSHHGHYWKITKEYMQKGTWKKDGISVTEERKAFIYEIVGSEKRKYQELKNPKRYYDYEFRMLKSLQEGNVKIYELKEVEEVTEVEKWVKVGENKTKKEKANKTPEAAEVTEPLTDYTINEDIDTRDNSKIWVVKINKSLSRDEYIKVNQNMKSLKGYYSRFKHGFIFKYNPTEVLNNNVNQNINTKIQDQADTIIDISVETIEKLNLNKMEYATSQEYKEIMSSYIKERNIKVTDELLNCIEYEELKNILISIKKDIEQVKHQEQQQAEKEKLLEKIKSSIESLQKKIDNLSGDYKTNTYKRMNEQAGREHKIESYQIDIKLIQHVQDKLLNNKQVTELEKGLIIGSFRNLIHQYYIVKYGKYPKEIKFPSYDSSLPYDGWYNKEVPIKQKRLKKYSISNKDQLNAAIDEYKTIYDSIDRYTNPKEQEIKKLEREYKLRQKNDIHFTPEKLVAEMLDHANINSNSIILEPSAGIGNIVDQIKKVTGNNNIDCIEMMVDFAELLRLKGYNVVGSDFLNYRKFNHYDFIIMNPPFSNNQDIEHIKHAYKMLKVGGKLVALSSKHWTFATDKKSTDFKDWIEDKLLYNNNIDPIFEMTNIQTQLIVIEKLEETKEQSA